MEISAFQLAKHYAYIASTGHENFLVRRVCVDGSRVGRRALSVATPPLHSEPLSIIPKIIPLAE